MVDRLANGTLSPNDSIIFYKNTSGIFESNPDGRITLMLLGCDEQRGPERTWYTGPEIYDRLTTWLFPILVIVGNMHLAALGW